MLYYKNNMYRIFLFEKKKSAINIKINGII